MVLIERGLMRAGDVRRDIAVLYGGGNRFVDCMDSLGRVVLGSGSGDGSGGGSGGDGDGGVGGAGITKEEWYAASVIYRAVVTLQRRWRWRKRTGRSDRCVGRGGGG